MRYGELAKAVARVREIAEEPNPQDKCLKCGITRFQASQSGGSYCPETTAGFHVWK